MSSLQLVGTAACSRATVTTSWRLRCRIARSESNFPFRTVLTAFSRNGTGTNLLAGCSGGETNEDLKKNPESHHVFTLEHGRLHYKGRLVLSEKSVWIPKLLAEFHATSTGGHSGVYRTYRRLSQSLYWKGMKGAVTNYVASCLVCQQNKYLAASPQGLL